MIKADFVFAGKILKHQGIKGNMIAALEIDISEILQKKESVFLEIKNELVPFFIEQFDIISPDTVVISFDDINSVEQTKSLLSCSIFIPVNQLTEKERKRLNNQYEIIGYKVMDTKHGEIGIVDRIIKNPMQSLLQIRSGEREILIPMTDNILIKTNHSKKIIIVTSPDGLIELNQ